MTRPRVALVKIRGLSPYLQQVYAPLLDKYDITCISLKHMDPNPAKGPVPTLQLGSVLSPALDRISARLVKRRYVMPNLHRLLSKYDVVEAVDLVTAPALQVARARKKMNFKMVLACAENIPFPLWEMPSKRAEVRRVVAAVDHFMPITAQSADVLRLLGVADDKITIVPHGIDCELFSPGERNMALAERLGLEKKRTAIFVGRLVWEKGVQDILAALAFLRENGKPIPHLLVLGTGEEEQYLKALMKDVGLEKEVSFLGAVKHEDLPAYYRLAEFSLVPSLPKRGWMEQFGVAAIEAMACGLPVIAGASGALPDVVDDGGVFVPPGSPYDLADAINSLMMDENLRREKGAMGRQIAENNYNAADLHKTIHEVYRQVLR